MGIRCNGARAGWLVLLVAAAACGGGDRAADANGPLLDPALVARLTTDTRFVRWSDAEGEALLERTEDGWQRADWGGLEVRGGRVEALVEFVGALRLGRAVDVPAEHASAVGLGAGVDDDSWQAEFLDADRRALVRVRVGHRDFGADVAARFARVDTSQAVIAALPSDPEPAELAPVPFEDRSLLALERDRVAAFHVVDAEGEEYRARRIDPHATEFEALDVPPGRAPASPHFASMAGRAPTFLPFRRAAAVDDVVPAAGSRARFEFETFDGLCVQLETFIAVDSPIHRTGRERIDGERWVVVACEALDGASARAVAEASELSRRTAGRAFLLPARETIPLRGGRLPLVDVDR